MALYQKSVAKKIISDRKQIRAIVSKAMNQMAEIVGSSLGPSGRPTLIEREAQSALASKDGMTIARSLGVHCAEENIIIESAKDVCIRTAKEAGDGTTTAIVLANAIVQSGLKFLDSDPKANPQRIINELTDLYENVLVPHIKKHAIPVSGHDKLFNVAKISANGDDKIARAVVEAVLAAGDDGTVLIEEGKDTLLKVETIEGYIATTGLKDLGNLGPIFINDRANQQVKMDNGIVFLYDGSINDLKVLSHIQEAIEETNLVGMPLIIMAHDFSDVAISQIAKNVKNGLTIVPVITPRSGVPNSKTMFLHDMAAYTNARIFDPGDIHEIDDNGFGSFTTARCNMYETFLICHPETENIENRLTELKSLADAAPSEIDKMHIKAAISKLTGGISTIWVGGASDLEIREKRARVEDAVEAVRSAISEGIVPGGCAMHLSMVNLIKKHKERKPSWVIMDEALMAPITLLLTNCGEDAEYIIKDIRNKYGKRSKKLPQRIFDANKHKFVDPIKSGIIEPAKVCRIALANAMSVAGTLFTLGGIVVTERDVSLENQMALADKAFSNMMSGGINGE